MTAIVAELTAPTVAPRPFLKWAGGKRALLAEIRLRTPDFEGKYIEPFLGAGAVDVDRFGLGLLGLGLRLRRIRPACAGLGRRAF